MMLCWLFLLACVSAVYVGWPMSEQLPNVARVDALYLFTLANTTYKSSAGGSVTYSASDLPLWLLFDALSRTFLGTPSSSDVETFSIVLSGVDSADNSNISETYLMLVSNSSGLLLSSADVMFTTIAKYGQTNGVDGLVVKQGESFTIEFSEDDFQLNSGAERPIIAYYGRSGDRSSLPNWILFDSDSLTFSGTVPYVTSDIAPSVEYTFGIIASDYYGFAGAEGDFKIVIGAHQLSTSVNESIKLNGTYGSDFDYTVPVFSDVYLDGEIISSANISSVLTSNLPDYVDFDTLDYTLSGTFPNASSFQNFTVIVLDVYGNLVSLPYTFEAIGSVFTVSSIPDVNATRGEYFLLQLLRSYFTDYDETTIDVSFANDSSWLSYHSSNLTMNGETPDDLDLVKVTVEADSDFGNDLLSFHILGVDPDDFFLSLSMPASLSATSSASSTSARVLATGSSSTATSSSSSTIVAKSSNGNHRKLILGLAIGIPGFVLLLALLLLIFCCCRRRKGDDDEKQSGTESAAVSTGPGFGQIFDDENEPDDARQLSTLNALKLDHDNRSTLSSLTHVDSEASESGYFDASEKPMVSWRANEMSDSTALKHMLLLQKHASGMSVDTVNTEQLFSVRLVDDNLSARNSSTSFGNQATRNSYVLPREISLGNVQRLDSDGNLALDGATSTSSPIRSREQELALSLNNIEEEDSNNTCFTQESSSYNLLAKFLGLTNGSPSSSIEEGKTKDLKDGEQTQWRSNAEDVLIPSPDAESFLLNKDAANSRTHLMGSSAEANLSRTSVYSDLSLKNGESKRDKAKLVDFTRKGSLRDSSRQQYTDHAAASALIYEDSD